MICILFWSFLSSLFFLTSPLIFCLLFSLLPSPPLLFSFFLFLSHPFMSPFFLRSTSTEHLHVHTASGISIPAGITPLPNLHLQYILHNFTRLNLLGQNSDLLNSFPKMHDKIAFHYLLKYFQVLGLAGALIIYTQLVFQTIMPTFLHLLNFNDINILLFFNLALCRCS